MNFRENTWKTSELIEQGAELIHHLALACSSALVQYRLLMGRCLLAALTTGLYRELHCRAEVVSGI